MISRKVMTKILCGNLNQEKFTLAADERIEDLRNGTKNTNTSKSTSFWLSAVEDVVRRKEYSFGNRRARTG